MLQLSLACGFANTALNQTQVTLRSGALTPEAATNVGVRTDSSMRCGPAGTRRYYLVITWAIAGRRWPKGKALVSSVVDDCGHVKIIPKGCDNLDATPESNRRLNEHLLSEQIFDIEVIPEHSFDVNKNQNIRTHELQRVLWS